ncbi:MAG: hypothetical protein R3279_07535 [Putridiphycobacter sp.]|nr:hypothetical protein [Putridiphycobacter sp.]
MTLQQITALEEIEIKVKADHFDIAELISFLTSLDYTKDLDLVLDHAFVLREINHLLTFLGKKIKPHKRPKSIRLKYFQVVPLQIVVEALGNSKGYYHSHYPQFFSLYHRIMQNFPRPQVQAILEDLNQ